MTQSGGRGGPPRCGRQRAAGEAGRRPQDGYGPEAGRQAAGREPGAWLTCCDGVELREALSAALSGREHVVMVRVNDETLRSLDHLVEAGICSSRSGAAAFLISQGIKANPELLNRAREVTAQIAELRRELRRLVGPQAGGADPGEPGAGGSEAAGGEGGDAI
ncbi:MAG: hypothetical protein K6T75_06940 [Acetobacteraceae bacterium]|nr:hypothetical protein [Acetobacteraceae bacterium]